jgi:hypothetical protein
VTVGEESCVEEGDIVGRRERTGQKVRAIPSFVMGHFRVCAVVLKTSELFGRVLFV